MLEVGCNLRYFGVEYLYRCIGGCALNHFFFIVNVLIKFPIIVMKICLLSSGMPRFSKACSEIIKSQLELHNRNVDYYGLFWEPIDRIDLDAHLDGFLNKKIWTAQSKIFTSIPNVNAAPETNIENFLSMLWGRSLLAAQLTLEGVWDKYDLFIYCRADVCLNRAVDFEQVIARLNSVDILVPTNGHWRGGVNDQICFGNKSIKKYLDLYDEFKVLLDEGVLLHPETMLKHYLLKNNIKIGVHAIKNYIFRGSSHFEIG